MRLSPARRKALVGAVSKRFLHEADTTGVASSAPAAELARYTLDEVPTGEVIKDGRGNPAFEKTDAGWKSVIKVPLERILMLVKEANREPVGKLLKDAGEGEVLTILLGFLADTEDANTDKGLRLKKVDGMFMDPVSIAPDKIKLIADQLKYQPPAKDGAAEKTAKVELGPDDRVFNNIIFKHDAGKALLKVIVDLDKGGTAQLKRLLGSDAAVTKADEQIAAAPASGESKITLRYDPTTTGNILGKAVPKRMFKSSTDLQFRYLPGNRVLVLDLTGISQAQWEEVAKQLDVGNKGKVGAAGLTISDLRQMQPNQIIEEKIVFKDAPTDFRDYAVKLYADVIYIIPDKLVSEGSVYTMSGRQIPADVSKLKVGTMLKHGIPTNLNPAVVGLDRKDVHELKTAYTYKKFLEQINQNSASKIADGLSQNDISILTYQVKSDARQEEI